MDQQQTGEQLKEYEIYLYEQERSSHTVEKYLRDVRRFFAFIEEKPISKQEVLAYKEYLQSRYAVASVNSMLVSLNAYFDWLGLGQNRVKLLRIQQYVFAKVEKELSQEEYMLLVKTAEQLKNMRLSLLIQTICATGIRVSELVYITVSSLHTRRPFVTCKGKSRSIFLPLALCKKLKRYCKENNISTGSVFVTKTGKPLNRSNIWAMMKTLCQKAGVETQKVFPHNLRHLFARTYYKIEKDISRLADILGHSSINTTRIYTMETGITHAQQIEGLGLIIDGY